MTINIDKLTTKIIHLCFYVLLFAVPLIFIPGHFELFQFNKMMLVYLGTIIITTSWLIKIIASKQVNIRRTPLDIPLLLFLASQVASTIFSIEPHTSIWGYYSRFHGGLLSTISYILLYYAFVSNFTGNKKQKTENRKPLRIALSALILSSTLVALYAILEHFGIDADYWVQDVRNRVFSTLGQPNWLATFLITVTPLALVKSLTNRFGIWDLEFGILYLALLYTKSRSGILGFAVMYSTFWLTLLFTPQSEKQSLHAKIKAVFTKNSEQKPIVKSLLLSTAILAIISLLVGTPFTPSLNQLTHKQVVEIPKIITQEPIEPKQIIGGSPTGEIRRVVWKGAFNIWKHWPIFGSGVETFAYSYYNFRPVEHNYLSEWDFLYNKAHNEHLNFLATTGIIGLATYLCIVAAFTVWSFKAAKKGNSQTVAFLSGFLGLQATLFFGFSTVTTGFLFFLFPAFALLYSDEKSNWLKAKLARKISSSATPSKLSLAQLTVILLVITTGLFLTTQIAKRWYADKLFAKGKRYANANQISQAILLEQKASQLVPDEPLFHDRLALDLARSAAALKLNRESTSAAQFAALAEAHSNLVMLQNPVHINYLKNRAAVMLHLETIDKSYGQKALDALLLAQKLSPTDPNLAYNLGLFYQQRGQTEKALGYFKKSAELKPDYELPKVALIQYFEKQGQPEKAITQYEELLQYYPDKTQYTNQIQRLATQSASQKEY